VLRNGWLSRYTAVAKSSKYLGFTWIATSCKYVSRRLRKPCKLLYKLQSDASIGSSNKQRSNAKTAAGRHILMHAHGEYNYRILIHNSNTSWQLWFWFNNHQKPLLGTVLSITSLKTFVYFFCSRHAHWLVLFSVRREGKLQLNFAIFRPYGRKIANYYTWFPSVRTEITWFPTVRTEIV